MISTTVTVVGGSMAYSAGAATATFLGQWAASEIASTTLLGTTLGAWARSLGTVFSIGFSFAIGVRRAFLGGRAKAGDAADLQDAMAKLDGGTINSLSMWGWSGRCRV